MITAEWGGSNGFGVKLQKLTDETGLRIAVCHVFQTPENGTNQTPPIFPHQPELARNAASQFQAIVNLIATTAGTTGLTVRS